MYETILVPTDGSEEATAAARHGLALARAFDATVHVLYALDVSGAAGPFDAGGVDESFRDLLSAEADEALGALESLAGGVDLQTATVEDRPRAAILDYVDDHDIDLVVMGTHGRRGLRRFVAGSVTEHVLRRSPVPVATVRRPADADSASDEPPAYESILVPTDGSECANAAVDHAFAVADAVDATVHVLSVVNHDVLVAKSDVTPTDLLLETLRERAEGAIRTVEQRAADAGLDVVTAVYEGQPAGAILEYVESEGMDFVVMGTHGRSGVDRFLLGSTAERLVRNAEVPVLTVRHAPD